MGIRTHIPLGATPLAAVDAIMAMYARDEIEIAIEELIAKLDAADGDPDIEDDDPRGDNLDRGEGPAWVEREERNCTNSYGDHEDDEESAREILHPQRDRIRRQRCRPIVRGGYVEGWRLTAPAAGKPR
jgi:hypothetical protein